MEKKKKNAFELAAVQSVLGPRGQRLLLVFVSSDNKSPAGACLQKPEGPAARLNIAAVVSPSRV